MPGSFPSKQGQSDSSSSSTVLALVQIMKMRCLLMEEGKDSDSQKETWQTRWAQRRERGGGLETGKTGRQDQTMCICLRCGNPSPVDVGVLLAAKILITLTMTSWSSLMVLEKQVSICQRLNAVTRSSFSFWTKSWQGSWAAQPSYWNTIKGIRF